MYGVSALEYERPFLGPLCKFLSLHPRKSSRRAEHVSQNRHHNCAEPSKPSPRVDAQQAHGCRLGSHYGRPAWVYEKENKQG